MLAELSVVHLLLVAVIVLAGTVSGIAGFGFAVVGTMALATLIDPATAVVFMIVPVFGTNLALARELSADQLRQCGTRFAPLIATTVVGTVVGMAMLESVPKAPLTIGLGVLSLAFVLTAQQWVPVPGLDRLQSICFVDSLPGMIGVGVMGGAVFGATNVGVQLIAYLRSFELSHSLFVGVVAMVFLGVNGLRVGAAAYLGLYPDLTLIAASVLAVVPAILGVGIGRRLRSFASAGTRRTMVLGLLSILAGAAVYVLSTRFRAPGMGSSKDEEDQPPNDD